MQLSQNSLSYSFAPDALKIEMLRRLSLRQQEFARRVETSPLSALAESAHSYGFLCSRYDLCEW